MKRLSIIQNLVKFAEKKLKVVKYTETRIIKCLKKGFGSILSKPIIYRQVFNPTMFNKSYSIFLL